MKKTLLYMITGVALTACSDDKEPGNANSATLTDMPIELTTNIGGITVEGSDSRAAHDPVADDEIGDWTMGWMGEVVPNAHTFPGVNVLTDFKLYGYYENGSCFANAMAVTRNSVTNNVTRNDGGIWYWPLDMSINMYGVAPSSYNLQRDGNGNMYMDVTVGQLPNVDIVYASANDKKHSDGTIELEFQHALAAIDVYIMNYSQNLTIAFHGAEFRHLKRTARLTLPNISTNGGGRCSWSTPTGDFGFHNTAPLGDQDSSYLRHAELNRLNEVKLFCYAPPRSAEDIEKGIKPRRIPMFHGKTTLFMLPQTLEGVWTKGDDINSKPCMTLEGYIYDKRTQNYIWDDGSYIVLPLSGYTTDKDGAQHNSTTWEAGKRYIYTLSFADKANADDYGENLGWMSLNEAAGITVGFSVEVVPIKDGDHPHYWID